MFLPPASISQSSGKTYAEFLRNIIPSSKLSSYVLAESDPSDSSLAVITFGPIRIHEIKYTFYGIVFRPPVLESGGQAGVTSVILPPYVAIWMYLRDRRKLGLGDTAGILIQLCVISLCASLSEFQNVLDISKLKSSRG